MNYKDISDHIREGKYVRVRTGDRWRRLDEDGQWWYKNGNTALSLPRCVYFETTWEVKPEEIFVWGACDSDGLSVVSSTKDDSHEIFGAVRRSCSNLKDNLFPIVNPQKFKLVPVKDDE